MENHLAKSQRIKERTMLFRKNLVKVSSITRYFLQDKQQDKNI